LVEIFRTYHKVRIANTPVIKARVADDHVPCFFRRDVFASFADIRRDLQLVIEGLDPIWYGHWRIWSDYCLRQLVKSPNSLLPDKPGQFLIRKVLALP